MIWIVMVLQASPAGPILIGTAPVAYRSEDACLHEAEQVMVRMVRAGLVVTVKCEAMRINKGAE